MKTATRRATSPYYKEVSAIIRRNVKAKRNLMGMKQSELAKSLGISQVSIAQLEGGKQTTRVPKVSLPTLCDIAQVFGVPVETFFIRDAFGVSE